MVDAAEIGTEAREERSTAILVMVTGRPGWAQGSGIVKCFCASGWQGGNRAKPAQREHSGALPTIVRPDEYCFIRREIHTDGLQFPEITYLETLNIHRRAAG
jgi:hypothetical protein